jgi:hypothetical protein
VEAGDLGAASQLSASIASNLTTPSFAVGIALRTSLVDHPPFVLVVFE